MEVFKRKWLKLEKASAYWKRRFQYNLRIGTLSCHEARSYLSVLFRLQSLFDPFQKCYKHTPKRVYFTLINMFWYVQTKKKNIAEKKHKQVLHHPIRHHFNPRLKTPDLRLLVYGLSYETDAMISMLIFCIQVRIARNVSVKFSMFAGNWQPFPESSARNNLFEGNLGILQLEPSVSAQNVNF